MDSASAKTGTASAAELNEAMIKGTKGMFEKIKTLSSVSAVQDEISKHMNEWKSCPIKIAISGASGAGKSSLINTLRGLKPGDKDAAKVDTEECTTSITKYRHPGFPNFELSDLPGFGTIKFPQSTYLSDMNIDAFDFFLLLTSTRFTENDLWLAKEIIKRKKRFYFLRTKIDVDIRNDKEDNPAHDTAKWLANTRKKCIEHLQTGGIQSPVVFLTNNKNAMQYDFSALQQKLIEDSPALKRDAVVLSLTAISEKILKEKLEVLKSKIFEYSVLATLGALVPIPGVGIALNYYVMKNAMEFYMEQLGIDDPSLRKAANQVGVTVEYLKDHLCLKSGKIFASQSDFCCFCENAHDQQVVDYIAKWLPLIGSIISAIKTAPSAVAIQKQLLDICYTDACHVLEYQSKWLKQNPDKL